MLKAAETTIRHSARAIISVMMAVALLMPAFPLSEVLPAHAAGAADSAPVPSEPVDASGDIVAPLEDWPDGDDQEATDASSTERIYADVPLTGAVVDTNGVVEGLTADLIEDSCGNCFEEADELGAEIEEQEAAREREAEEARAQDIVPTHEEVLAGEQALEAAEAAQLDLAPADPAMTPEDVVSNQTAAQSASAEPAAAAEAAADYSTAVVLKNIQSITLYDNYNQARTSQFSMNTPRNYPERYTVVVRAYGMPRFDAPLVSARYAGGIGYLTVRLPQGTGEEGQTVELAFTRGVGGDGWINQVTGLPAVTDATVLAGLAAVVGYDQARDQAYLNAYKLAPFASLEDIVASGNRIPAGSALATKTIAESWPIHKDDGMKVSLFEDDLPDITRFFVYYSDGTSETFDVGHLGFSGLAASYVAQDTGILYQPDFWVMDGEECLAAVDRMAAFIRSKTWNSYYGSYCASQSSSKGVTFHRTVRDYFDEDIRNNAEEVAANLLTNIADWCPTSSSRNRFNLTMNTAETASSSEQDYTTTPEVKLFNVLFLYTYWERFLGFDLGGSPEVGAQKNANAFLVLAFRGNVIRSGLSILSMTYTVRSFTMVTYSYVDKLSTMVMNMALAPSTGIYDSVTFTQVLVKRLTGYADTADWFADYMDTIAFYHEYEPPAIEGVSDAGQLTWRGWDQAKRFPDNLLLWLTLPPGSQYFASTSMLMATGPTGVYSADAEMNDEWRTYFKGKMDAVFNYAKVYSATVASIVGVQRPNMFCVLTLDSKVSKYDKGTSWMETEKLTGKTLSQDPYHKGFSDPTCLYITSGQGSAAMTFNNSDTSKRIHFTAYASLNCAWSYYWSHEMAHAIDNTVFLNGDRRGGNNTEDYTDGLLTQGHGVMSYIMNLSYDYAPTADVMSNLTTERITGKENIDDFYGKLYDTMDVVDYAALQAFLRLDKDEQNAVASQAWFAGQNGTSALDSGSTATTLYSRNWILSQYDGTDATTPMNSAAFNDGSKKFETAEEVYDNQVFLRPGISNTSGLTWLWANYVGDDLRGVWWFPIHCNGNRPDSRSFKLEIYRMLGYAGYDAWANFGRSGGSDLTKLKQITGFDSFKEWQMAKWDAIEEDKAKLSYVAFDDLVDKFEAALKTDAGKNDRNLTQMHNLRLRMMYMMKRVTNDFRYGIYDNQAPVVEVHNVEELAAIAENPLGNYALAADIDVAGYDLGERTTLVDAVFYGKLDGRGHKIFSSQNETVPTLFTGAKQAYIKDVALHGVIARSVAKSVVNCELENVTYALFERYIYTVDDFLALNNDLKLGLDTFHVMADLDFTEWSTANALAEGSAKKTAVITQVMAGTEGAPKVLNGNGHTITGLSGASLFERVAYADIHELTIADSKNMQDTSTGSYAALVAKRSYKSTFSDLYFRNVSLSGRVWVGCVSGDDGIANAANKDVRDGGSTFRRIQVYDGTVVVGNNTTTAIIAYGGFITGRACLSSMEDVYVQGTLNSYGTACGGLTGALTKAGSYERCISRVNAYRQKATYKSGNNTLPTKVAVLIGEVEEPAFDAENTRIARCFGLGDPCPNRNDAYIANPAARLANLSVPDAAGTFQRCYESATARYGTTLVGTEGADVSYVRLAAKVWENSVVGTADDYACFPLLRSNPDFFTDLGFGEDVWQFDPTIKLGNPVLRFDGDPDTYYVHDAGFSVDFQNEQLCFSGSDFNPATMQVHNLPYKMTGTGGVVAWGGLAFSDNPRAVKYMYPDENNRVSITEAIEHEGFANAEVERKGTRTVTLMQRPTVADLYRVDAFETSIEIPPRLENAYADNIKGVRPDSSKALGSIRVLSVGSAALPELEYRAAQGAEGEGEAAAATDAPWIPITAASTPVAPGTYEVRLAATDHSFASYPTTVVVDAFDPASITFPLTLDPMGGTWAEGFTVPVEHSSEEATVLPTSSDLARGGYIFTGWYESADLSGEPVKEVPVGTKAGVTLHAGWKACTYSVALELGGGQVDGADALPETYTYGVGAALPTPTRPGYEFEGWYESADFAGEAVAAIGATDTGNKRFWAKWAPVVYDVTLHLAGGALAEGVADTFSYSYGAGAALPGADAVTREGCGFGGWFGNEACTGTSVQAITASDTGDKDLWAKWVPNTYNVVLAKDKGTLKEGEHDLTSYRYGTGAVLPELERAGYTFAGWYPDPDFADQPVFAIDAAETGDKQFWAKWEPVTYRIEYHLGTDAAGNAPEGIDLSEFASYSPGEGLVLPTLTWEGHTFVGWYKDAAFTGAPLTEVAAGSYGDLDLYARWASEACVLRYYTGGGTFDATPKTLFEFGVDGVQAGDVVPLPDRTAIVRTGYSFEGWYANAELEGDPVESVTLGQGSIDLFAKWSVVEYKVAFDLNGGAWAPEQTVPERYTVESGDVMLPGASAVVREGFEFGGWYDDADFAGEAISLIASGDTGDKAFIARWVEEGAEEVPDLEITSLVITGVSGKPLSWDEQGMARIEVPRSKMPQKPEDFAITVPDGVRVSSIAKREAPVARYLVALLEAVGAAEGGSEWWDIVLQSIADPSYEKRYALEVVPIDEGDDGNIGDGNVGDDDGNAGGNTGGNTGGNIGDGNAGDGNTGGNVGGNTGNGNTGGNVGDGSGNTGGNGNGNGTGSSGGTSGGANGSGTGSTGGNGGSGGSGGSQGSTGTGGNTGLAATGDDATALAVSLAVVSLLSALLALLAFRRSGQRR